MRQSCKKSYANDENENRIRSLMCILLTIVSVGLWNFFEGGSKLLRFLAKLVILGDFLAIED